MSEVGSNPCEVSLGVCREIKSSESLSHVVPRVDFPPCFEGVCGSKYNPFGVLHLCSMAAVPQLVETVKDLSELATLSMQAMVIFDDFDDKVTEKDGLLQRMNLTKAQVDTTLQGLRDIVDAAHRARDQASDEVVRYAARPDHGDDGEK